MCVVARFPRLPTLTSTTDIVAIGSAPHSRDGGPRCTQNANPPFKKTADSPLYAPCLSTSLKRGYRQPARPRKSTAKPLLPCDHGGKSGEALSCAGPADCHGRGAGAPGVAPGVAPDRASVEPRPRLGSPIGPEVPNSSASLGRRCVHLRAPRPHHAWRKPRETAARCGGASVAAARARRAARLQCLHTRPAMSADRAHPARVRRPRARPGASPAPASPAREPGARRWSRAPQAREHVAPRGRLNKEKGRPWDSSTASPRRRPARSAGRS